MATKRPAKPRRTPRQEAADPATDPARLLELATHENVAVMQAAWRNPSLPEIEWRKVLLEGHPEAWANPMAPLYLLAWTPSQDDPRPLEEAAQWATDALRRDPKRCSPEGKALLASKITEWWTTSESIWHMMRFLGWWANMNGKDSPEHREVARILVLCVRTAPSLTDDDRQALDLLQPWRTGGKNRRYEAESLASSKAAKYVVWFALDPSNSPWSALHEVLEAVERTAGPQAKAEHERHLAGVIRQEMPLPPVVE
jgi:hypothetical protein